MYVKSVLLLTAFVASAVAGPLSSRGSCARHCTESSKLNYEIGKSYKYDYVADTTTTMSGAIDEESRLHIKATVLLTVHSKCDLSMQLRDVSLEESDPKFSNSRQPSKNTEKFSEELSRHSLRFSFQDGKIEEICPSDNEASWVLNLKRGVLSTFQNSMEQLDKSQNFDEVDVAGKCPVVYEALGSSWGKTTIKKSKELVKCTERQTADTSIRGSTYDHESEIKSNPLITGKQTCTQVMKYQRIEKAECHENLVFRPFSNKESGAITKATQTLTYNSESASTFTGDEYEAIRSTLIFNHKVEGQNGARRVQEAEAALQTLCESSVDDIRKEVPHLFTQFVYRLRQLSQSDLQTLNRNIERICNRNIKGKKYFTDALPVVSTEHSVGMMMELVKNGQVSESEADYWFTSFAFVSKPNLKMLNHLLSALENPSKQAVLGISSMVNNWCQIDSNCAQNIEVRNIVTKLTAKLNGNCNFRSEANRESVLIALKGLGNIGFANGAVETLNRCVRNAKTNLQLRIAAANAFARQPCTNSRHEMLTTFRDMQDETEIRIAAYLATMKCPTSSLIQNIKQVLDAEEVNQVGSFVWTHLTNMQETADPCKKDIKELLQSVFLEKKFNTDSRKFSRAYEGSIFVEKINTGAHIDGNVIFTPESYLPRSAMFNLTMDLFGHSLNMFEIGGRVEGFEHIVESFFGPSGYFPDKNIKKLLRSSRNKRSSYDNKIEEFQRLFKERDTNRDEPEGSMYLKMFGNELLFGQFKGLESLKKYATSQINWVQILADLAENRDVEYTKSMMFMDASYTIPTTIGLPLSLSVNGTSTMNLKLGGKLDVRNLLKKEIDINGHIRPSGAVEISAVMAVDAFYAQTGLKMVATMHSSTFIDGKIQMKNGKVLTTQMNVPKEKIEIFDVQTNIFVIHQNVERLQKGVEEERTEMEGCTGDRIETITGLKLCGVLQFPNASMKYDSPYFPMTGPTRFAVFVEKTDKKMTGYKFDASWENTNDKKTALLSFNTPGSRFDREMTIEMSYDKRQKDATFRLRTPIKKIGVNGKLVNEEGEKKAEFSVTLDDIEQLAFIGKMDMSKMSQDLKYTTLVEVRKPGMKTISVKGNTMIQPQKRFNTLFTIENLTEKLIEFTVDLFKQREDRYTVECKLDSYFLSSKVKGNIHMRQRSSTTNMDVDYSFFEARTETVKIGSKLQDMSASSLKKWKISLNVDPSAAPNYKTSLNWETQIANGHIENIVKFQQGNRGRGQFTAVVQEIVSYSFTPRKNSIYTNLKLQVPTKNINYVTYFKHQNTDTYTKSRAFVQYATGKRVALQLLGLVSAKKSMGEINFSYPGRKMYVQSKFEDLGRNKYEGYVAAQWIEGQKMTATVKYADRSNSNEMNHDINVVVALPSTTVEYNGEVKVDRVLYMTKNKVTVGNDLYMVDVEFYPYEKKLTSVAFIKGQQYKAEAFIEDGRNSISGSLDLKLHTYRRITSKASYSWMSKRIAKFNLLWDADNDNKQKVELDASFDTSNNQLSVLAYYPERNLKLNLKPEYRSRDNIMSSKFEGDFSWDRSHVIRVNFNLVSKNSLAHVTTVLKLTTPFYGYQEVLLRHNHQLNSNGIISKMSGSIDKSNFVNLDVNSHFESSAITNVKGAVKLTSSINGYESLGVEMEHMHSASNFRSNASVSVGRYDVILFSADGTDNSNYYATDFRGKFTFNSPYENFRLLTGSLSHRFTGQELTSTGTFKWNQNKEITVKIGGSQTKNGDKNICKGTLRIDTPFRDYYTIRSTVNYERDNEVVKTDVVHQNAGNRFTTGFETKQTMDSTDNKIEFSTYYTSPYHEDLSARINFEDKSQKFLEAKIEMIKGSSVQYGASVHAEFPNEQRSKINAEVNWLSKSIKAGVDVSNRESKKTLNTFLKSPYHEDLRLILSTQNSVNLLKMNANLKKGNQRYNVVNIFKQLSNGLEFETDIRTPFEDYRKMQVSMKFEKIGMVITSSVEGSINDAKGIINLNAKYDKWNNAYDYTISVKTPFTSYEQMQVVGKHQWSSNSVLNNLKYTKGWEQVVFDHSLTFEGSLNFKNKIDISHPYRDYPQIEINDVLSVGSQGVSCVSSIGTKDSKFWKMTVEYKPMTSKIEALFGLEDHNGKIFLLDATYDSGRNTFNPSLKLTWRNGYGQENILLSGSWTVYEVMKQSAQLRMTSTFRGYESIVLQGDFDLAYQTKSARLSLTKPDSKIISLTGKFDANERNAMISFASPYEGYEDLTLSGNYVFDDNMKGDISFQWAPRSKVELQALLMKGESHMTTTLSFGSPFAGFEKMTFNANYDFSRDTKIGSVDVEYQPGKRITFKQTIRIGSGNGNIETTITTPFEKYAMFKMTSNFDVAGERKTANVDVEWPFYNKVTVNGEFNNRENDKSVKVTVKTPMTNLRSLVLSGRLTKNSNVIIMSAKSTWNQYNTMELIGNFQMQANRMLKTTLTFTSPFENFKNLKFEIDMEKYGNTVKGSTAFLWDETNRIALSVNAQKDPLEIIIKADSPFEPFKNVKIVTTFSNHLSTKLITNVEWMYNKKIQMELGFENKNKEMSASFLLRTPFEGFDEMKMNGKIEIGAYQINVNFDAKFPLEVIPSLNAQFSYNMRPGSIDSTLKIDTDQTLLNIQFLSTAEKFSLTVRVPKILERPVTFESILKDNTVTLTFNDGYLNYELKTQVAMDNGKYKLTMESDIPSLEYRFRQMKIIGSFETGPRRIADALLSFRDNADMHSIEFSTDLLEKSIKANMVVKTPLIESKELIISGTIEYDRKYKIDFSIRTPRKIYTISGEIKNTGGYFAYDSPSDFLGTARIDVNFRLDGIKNSMARLKLVTSNPSFNSAVISARIVQQRGKLVSRLELNTPFSGYDKVSLSLELTHNNDWTVIEPLAKFTMPSMEWAISGSYEKNYDHKSIKAQIINDKKTIHDLTVQIDNKQYAGLMIYKRQKNAWTMEEYQAQLKHRAENGRHFLDGSISLPNNKKATLSSQMLFADMSNFDGRVSASSSFSGFESWSTSILRKVTSTNTQSEFVSTWLDQTIKVSLTTDYENQNNKLVGTVKVSTPWEVAREMSTSFSTTQKRYQNDFSLEASYKGQNIFKLTTNCNKGSSSMRTLTVEVPMMGLKGSSMYKIGSASEASFKIEIPSRVVFFRTEMQPNARGFKHSTEFAWNQRNGGQGSYEVIYQDKSRTGLASGDLAIRIIHPIRSIELKFIHEVTSRDVKVTSKFMWDPLRDTRKQITVIIEGKDSSVYGKKSYDGTITLRTPKLYNDAKLSGSIDFSERHREIVKGKIVLDYTGDRRKALEYEFKVTDETRRRSIDGISYTFSTKLTHPASVTYMSFFTSIMLTEKDKQFNIRLGYVDRFSTRKSYVIRTNLNRKKLHIQAASPSKMYELIGKSERDRYEMDIKVNKQKTIFAQYHFNAKNNIVQGEVNYIPTNDGIKFRASADDSLSVVMSHKNGGRDISDFLFTLAMSSPKVLSTRMIWRTTILGEIKNEIAKGYYAYKGIVASKGKDIIEHIGEEFSTKVSSMKRLNAIEMKPLFDDWNMLSNELYNDYVVLSRQAKDMYVNNEFYVRNICDGMQYMKNTFSKYYYALKIVVNQKLESIAHCLNACFNKAMSSIANFYYETINMAVSICNTVRNGFWTMWDYATCAIVDSVYYVLDGMSNLIYDVAYEIYINAYYALEYSVEFVVSYIPYSDVIAEYAVNAFEYVSQKWNSLETSKIGDLLNNYYAIISTFCEEVYNIELVEIAAHYYEETWNKISDKFSSAQDTMYNYYQIILQHPFIAVSNELANHGYQKVAWAYRFWGIDKSLDNLQEEWMSILSTIMTDIAHDATNRYTTFIQDSKFLVEPTMGRIEIDVRLPADRKNLMHLLDVGSAPELQYLMALKERYMPKDAPTAWDMWYMYKPDSDITNWIPPFKTEGMLAGKQHFMTFDKLFYNYAGECSYVLAHDLLDGNFSVIVSYEKKYDSITKKSIVVRVDDSEIEITPSFKAIIDGAKVELPHQFEKTMISRFDDTITINNENGITVRCNFYRDVCTVKMSGWYFAKTGGLLGTYNNEPKLDMMKPNGYVTKSLTEFGSSWAAGSGQCKQENYADRASMNDYQSEKICKSIFKSEESSLRPCFKILNTEEYMKMCMIDVQNKPRSLLDDEAICTAAYAYKQRCMSEGIEVTMPSSCGRCKKSDGTTMQPGDVMTITDDNKPSVTDIVFIVEEKQCNKEKFEKFEEITQGIERSLRDKRIRRASYFVVGYGGDGVHNRPHIHYAESEESGNYRNIASAFRSLTVGNGDSDDYEAIRFATNLRFTPGASKIFVLVKCSTCENSKLRNNYGDVLRMLVDQSISLHVLMDNNFSLRSGSKKSDGILGLDKHEAFTVKDGRDKDIKGDKDLRAQINYVKDFCVPLALETNGTLFNSHKLISNRRNVQKNFIHVFSRRLARSSNTPECQLCTCNRGEDSAGKIRCSTCISPFDIGLFSPNLPNMASFGNKMNAKYN